MKIEQNCLLLLIRLTEYGPMKKQPEIIFQKNLTPEDEHDGKWRDMIQNTNQIKITPTSNFVAMLEKVFFCKNLSSIDPVLGSSPSPTGHANRDKRNFSALTR